MKRYSRRLIILLICTIFIASQANIFAKDKANSNDVQVPTLTIEQAILMGIKNNLDLKNLNYELEQAQQLRDKAGESVQYYRPEGIGLGYDDLAQRNILKSYKGLEVNLEMKKKQLDYKKETIIFNITNAYNEITKLEKQKTLMEKVLENATLNLKAEEVKYRHGLLSKMGIESSRNSYIQLKKQKINLEISVDGAYNNLNSLIGAKKNERYTLVKEIVFKPLEDFNLEQHIIRQLQDSFYIWSQEQAISLAELELKLYTYNAGQEPYSVKEISVNKEKNNLANIKLSIDSSIRSLYNQIMQLENQYNITLNKHEDTQIKYEGLKKRFELGMITQLQLKAIQTELLKTQNELDEIAIQHETLRALLDKPYLIPGA